MFDFNFEEYLKKMIEKGCCTSAIMHQFVCNAETLMYINPNESSDEAIYQCHALKTLKELIATSDQWLPILEADICEMEANSPYFAEKRELEEEQNRDDLDSVMEYDSLMSTNYTRKERNRKTKQNGKRNTEKAKRLHKSDRRHGKTVPQSDKKFMDSLNGTIYRWDEKEESFDSKRKPPVRKRRKTFRNRLEVAMDAREKEEAHLFTGFGELLEDIIYLEDRIRIYEEDIQDLEYEKAFGYLTDEGREFLEDYKKELEELKEYKKYKEILLRTATH